MTLGSELEEHPDGEPEDHEAEFHLLGNLGEERAAKSHAKESRDAGPGDIDAAVVQGYAAEKFNPAPERLREHQVTSTI